MTNYLNKNKCFEFGYKSEAFFQLCMSPNKIVTIEKKFQSQNQVGQQKILKQKISLKSFKNNRKIMESCFQNQKPSQLLQKINENNSKVKERFIDSVSTNFIERKFDFKMQSYLIDRNKAKLISKELNKIKVEKYIKTEMQNGVFFPKIYYNKFNLQQTKDLKKIKSQQKLNYKINQNIKKNSRINRQNVSSKWQTQNRNLIHNSPIYDIPNSNSFTDSKIQKFKLKSIVNIEEKNNKLQLFKHVSTSAYQEKIKCLDQSKKNNFYDQNTTNHSQTLTNSQSIKNFQNDQLKQALSQIVEVKNQTQSLFNSKRSSFKNELYQSGQNPLGFKMKQSRIPMIKKSSIFEIHLVNPQVNQIKSTISIKSDVESGTQYSFVLK